MVDDVGVIAKPQLGELYEVRFRVSVPEELRAACALARQRANGQWRKTLNSLGVELFLVVSIDGRVATVTHGGLRKVALPPKRAGEQSDSTWPD
jgi:hypothetical protein